MKPNDTLEILDGNGRQLGHFEAQEYKYGAWCGVFFPSAHYRSIKPLFEEFASCVEQLSLAQADEIKAKIESLGIHGRLDGTLISLHDIQFYSDGASVRIK